MSNLYDELRQILGPVLDLPPASDAEAVRWIMEMKSMPNPTPERVAWIKSMEDAWHRAAAADMARR